MFSNLWNIHEPVAPVWFVKMIFLGVEIDFREIELWSVPTTNPIVSSKVPDDGVLVGLALVPLGEKEHVLTVLVGEPGDGLRSLETLVVPVAGGE